MRCDVRKMMIVPVLTILAAAPAAAQDVVYQFEQRIGTPAQGDVFTLPVPPPPGAGAMVERFGLLAVEPFDMGSPVTGVPYTADISTDVVQQLADGNRIEHHTTSSVARDGQGRTRREQQLTAIGAILPQVDGRIITIMDPVAKVHYSLDPARKVAMRSPLPVFKRFDGAARTGAGVSVAAGVAGAATVSAETVVINAGAKNARTESLGTSQIEGVQAQGTRTVVTIPAGAIGNQAPIEMVTEQWFSPELGSVVLSRRSDPRFGETTYRLQNIVRAEPSPELFQVPADYTVDAVPAFGPGTFQGKPFTAP
jgi:hypothetical protein